MGKDKLVIGTFFRLSSGPAFSAKSTKFCHSSSVFWCGRWDDWRKITWKQPTAAPMQWRGQHKLQRIGDIHLRSCGRTYENWLIAMGDANERGFTNLKMWLGKNEPFITSTCCCSEYRFTGGTTLPPINVLQRWEGNFVLRPQPLWMQNPFVAAVRDVFALHPLHGVEQEWTNKIK